MGILHQFALLLRITRSYAIARRYFVVNGFDGALTMLGLITGFYISGGATPAVTIGACLGAAIALGMSGLSSAYISESAERRRELQALENAMLSDLTESAHARAARIIPAFIALVNGLAPLLISLVIISPLWLATALPAFPFAPLESAIVVALVIIFLLGVFLGRISGTFWLLAGLRTLCIALLTCGIIMVLTPR